MRILLVHNSYQHHGGEDVVFENERKLLVDQGNIVTTYRRSNNELHDMSLFQRGLSLKAFISSNRTKSDITRILREAKPEVVHVHNTFAMISPSVFDACKLQDIPVVQTLHNYRLMCPAATLFRSGHICTECEQVGLLQSIKYGCYRNSRLTTAAMALSLGIHRQRRTWATKIDAYIAPSKFVLDKLTVAEIPKRKVFVKPNCVTPDPGARPRIGSYAVFVGRLSEEKGLSTLIRAWSILEVDLPLRIVGDGPMRPRIEAEISERGLKNVNLVGRLEGRDVLDAIKGAKFLVFPSECFETFGIAIVEAFACGVPVIGSRLGACEELIIDGMTGLHFTAGDAEDLASKIDWTSRHPIAIAEMGEAARREYEEKYTAGATYEELVRIYRFALNEASYSINLPVDLTVENV